MSAGAASSDTYPSLPRAPLLGVPWASGRQPLGQASLPILQKGTGKPGSGRVFKLIRILRLALRTIPSPMLDETSKPTPHPARAWGPGLGVEGSF